MSSLLSEWQDLGSSFLRSYRKATPSRVQLIDLFLLFALATGALQVLYLLVAGQYPYNSFLAGFISAVGFFVLTVCLRMQLTDPRAFGGVSAEGAFASYVCCNVLLFFVVATFMG